MMRICLLFLLGLLILPPAHGQETRSLRFQNDKGSIAEFTHNISTGDINGHYISALGCAVDKPYPLKGWINGNAISFTVNFGDCNSITAWVGHFENDTHFKTIWTLSKGGSNDWNTLLTGASTFTRLNEGDHNVPQKDGLP